MHRCPCENEKERVKCSRSINFYGDLNVHGKLTAKSLVVKDAKINDLAAGGIITEALAAKELAAKELVAKDAKIENLIVKDLIFDTTNLFNNVTLTGNTNISTAVGDAVKIGAASTAEPVLGVIPNGASVDIEGNIIIGGDINSTVTIGNQGFSRTEIIRPVIKDSAIVDGDLVVTKSSTLLGNISINDGSINIGTHEGDVTTIGGAGSSVNINNANQIRLAAQSAVVSGNILYVIGNNLYFGKTKLTRN